MPQSISGRETRPGRKDECAQLAILEDRVPVRGAAAQRRGVEVQLKHIKWKGAMEQRREASANGLKYGRGESRQHPSQLSSLQPAAVVHAPAQDEGGWCAHPECFSWFCLTPSLPIPGVASIYLRASPGQPLLLAVPVPRASSLSLLRPSGLLWSARLFEKAFVLATLHVDVHALHEVVGELW
jgi:hypothetical protein